MRYTGLYLFLGMLVFSLTLKAADRQVRVIVESAAVHAEANVDSYLIDHVSRGTILSLFQPGRIRENWYYVKFTSRRYGAPVTGFILADQVAPHPAESGAVGISRTPVKDPPKTEPPPPVPDIRLGDTAPPPERSILPSRIFVRLVARPWVPKRSPSTPARTGLGFSPVPGARSLRMAGTADSLRQRFMAMDPAPPPPPAEQAPEIPADQPGTDERQLTPDIHMRRTDAALEFTLDPGPFDTYRHFTMTDPDRIIVDLKGSGGRPSSRRIDAPHPDLSAIRTGLFESDVTRVVFDFTGRLPAFTIDRDGDRLLIVLFKPIPSGKPPATPAPRIDLGQTPCGDARPPVPSPSGRVEARVFNRMPRPGPPPAPWLRTAETDLPSRPGLRVPPAKDAAIPTPWPSAATTPPTARPAARPPTARPAARPPIQTPAPTFKKPADTRGRMLLGLGYGASPGGVGVFFQINLRSGLAFHAGLGAYPSSLIYQDSDWVKNRMLASVGIKAYLPLQTRWIHPYLDIQYGGLRVEAVQVITRIWDYAYEYSNEQKTLYGPSLLGGFELRFGRLGLNAAGGISYALTEWEWQENRLQAALDIGLVIHF